MCVVEAVSKRVFRKIYGRGGCLAQGNKIAASSGIQHDGSDTAADGPFPPGKAKKGRQRIRELRVPAIFLIPKAQTSSVDSKKHNALSGINMNSRAPRIHLAWFSGG
jgi:hypothetical protein